MPASVTIDVNDKVHSFTEDMGTANGYRRVCLVTGLTATGLTDIVTEARTAMDSAGFEYYDTTAADSNLRVVSREFETVPGTTNSLYCTVSYAPRKDVLGTVGTWTPVLSGTINQVQTPSDINGFPITVAHQFPNDDENHPGQYIEQGCKAPQFRPMVEVTYKGLQQYASPFLEMTKYLGMTNLTTWNYGNPGRWLCTNFTADIHDASTTPVTWYCEVTFQADGFAWDPIAVFIDPSTGNPPAGLVAGTGYRKVITQRRADFNDLIPAG